MKYIKKLTLVILAVASLSVIRAQAQFDYFAQPRTVVVSAAQSIGGTTAVTNGWVDVHHLAGIAKLDISDYSVAGNNGGTFAIQGSADQTNVVTLANVALATQNTTIYTNGMYGGTALTATNTANLAGVVTTPVAASSGWSTTYLAPAQFTNSATGLTMTSNSVTTVGFKVDDAPRYIRIVWTDASVTTNIVSATLTAQ